MQATMMKTQLSLNHLLERAGKFYGSREVVSRRPDKSLHRTTYAEVYRRTRQLAKALRTRAKVQRGEAVGKRGITTNAGRKNFQRHDAVELPLPRLVNRAHAALADEF